MAIDDNTSYELTGAQVKDLSSKVNAKADSSSLATVATTGSYNDLSNQPTIPTVNNGTLTIQQNGTTVGTFSANQGTSTTVNLAGGIYADDPTAPANPNAWITSSDVDWSSFGDLSGSGFLQVVKKVDTRNINNGDNDFSVDISNDIPSGFFPIGIVGRNMSGSGYTRIRITREFISDDGTKIWVSNYFDFGQTSSITTTFYILCARTS